MAEFVSPLSFRALLQDVTMSSYSSDEDANDDMIDEAAMNREYYVGMQSTQPAAWPMPEGGDPLPLAGTPLTQHGFSRSLPELL
ncbi:TPA: hypothetical protein ACH3X3_013533 [Trebouxia sp. C0006]